MSDRLLGREVSRASSGLWSSLRLSLPISYLLWALLVAIFDFLSLGMVIELPANTKIVPAPGLPNSFYWERNLWIIKLLFCPSRGFYFVRMDIGAHLPFTSSWAKGSPTPDLLIIVARLRGTRTELEPTHEVQSLCPQALPFSSTRVLLFLFYQLSWLLSHSCQKGILKTSLLNWVCFAFCRVRVAPFLLVLGWTAFRVHECLRG